MSKLSTKAKELIRILYQPAYNRMVVGDVEYYLTYESQHLFLSSFIEKQKAMLSIRPDDNEEASILTDFIRHLIKTIKQS